MGIESEKLGIGAPSNKHEDTLGDPTKFSILPFPSSERRFWEIKAPSPADQLFLTRILKGVIPVSDVVYDPASKKFYSYEMPIETVEKVPNKLDHKASIDADLFVLSQIFGDGDHEHGRKSGDKNIRDTGDAHVLYDFEFFADEFWASGNFEEIRSAIERLYPRDKEMLGNKVSQLENMLMGVEGMNFLQAIVDNMEKTGAGLPVVLNIDDMGTKQNALAAFQKEVLKRLGHIKYCLSR